MNSMLLCVPYNHKYNFCLLDNIIYSDHSVIILSICEVAYSLILVKRYPHSCSELHVALAIALNLVECFSLLELKPIGLFPLKIHTWILASECFLPIPELIVHRS